MKRGRKPKHYISSTGKPIEGLAHDSDGRWRVMETGKRFTASNEAEALATFYKLTGNSPVVTIMSDFLGTTPKEILEDAARSDFVVTAVQNDDGTLTGGSIRKQNKIEEKAILAWIKDQLLNNSIELSQKLGIPQLANFQALAVPETVSLTKILMNYEKVTHTEKTKKVNIKNFKTFMGFVGNDLSPKKLIAYRNWLWEKYPNSSTCKTRIDGLKAVFSFARKQGIATPDLSVIYPPKKNTDTQPNPISREDFHLLLQASDNIMKTALLLGLNCCMYLDDIANIKWSEIDLEQGTYCGRRGKTGIIRSATLFPETIEHLKKLPRKSEWVLTSATGINYTTNALRLRFHGLRDKLHRKDLTFNQLRDGAYTYSANAVGIEEKYARLLAGHASTGMADHYVQRNPKVVEGACKAVYKAYF